MTVVLLGLLGLVTAIFAAFGIAAMIVCLTEEKEV